MARRIPEVLTDDERLALLAAPSRRAPTGIRNRAMIAIMLDAGLRCAECCGLGLRDVDLQTGRIMVRQGKGKKDRIVWAGAATLDAIAAWLDVRPEGDGPLFCTLNGKPVHTSYVRAMLDRMEKRAGIRHNVSPHTLRHTCATDLLRQTGNLRIVQRALGHSSITTTTIYAHIVDDELADAMRKLRGGEK
jgi:integrase/recombinase XerD